LRVSALLAMSVITGCLFANSACANDADDRIRSFAISAATKLYPTYVNDNFPELAAVKGFGKSTAGRAFRSAAIFELSSGYILYNPMNGITFILINMGGGNNKLIGLSPSQLFALVGHPPLKAEDQHLDVVFNQIPEAIGSLRDKIKDMRSDQVLAYLTDNNRMEPAVRKEAQELLQSPFIRMATYLNCLKQLDEAALNRKVKTDLINAGMAEVARKGFDYVDFIPLGANQAMLVQAAKVNGLFYVVSAVDTSKTCTITMTGYKSL